MKKFLNWLISLFYEKPTERKPMKIGIVLLKNSQPADGVSQNLVQITLTDNSGAPAPDTAVNLSVTNGTIQASGVTDSSGTLTVPVTSSNVGMSIITATALDGAQASDSTLYFVAVQPVAPATPAQSAAAVQSPLAILKARVAWIESRISELGEEAEEEIAALAEKYL